MLVAVFAFFSQISDPRFGGTYMTLFNTVNALGYVGPNTLALNLVDTLTSYQCSNDAQNTCSTSDLKAVSHRTHQLYNHNNIIVTNNNI